MQASRPGGARAARRSPNERPERWGASRRLACLLVLLLALSGHARRTEQPVSAELERGVAEIVLERDGALVARGSGVVIAAREEEGAHACYLVTVGHVVAAAAGPSAIVVVLPADGGDSAVPGKLIRQIDADDRDLAVVRVVAPTCRPVSIAPSIEWGADVWLAGFPARGAVHIWPGHVREMPSPGESRWTIDGAVTEGASGGVFDARTGALVGLIQGYWTVRLVGPGGSMSSEVATGRTAVIPVAQVGALLRDWGLEGLLEE